MQTSHPTQIAPRPSVRRLIAFFSIVAALGLFSQTACDTTAQQQLDLGTGETNGQQGAGEFAGSPAPAAAPLDGLASDDAAGGESLTRDIEEADLVKIVGDKLYALNQYKGLLIVDVADADHPALLGSFDLRGRGVEMYIVGDRAFVLLSADYYYAYYDFPVAEPGFGGGTDVAIAIDGRPLPPQPEFDGSQLDVIDLSDPTAPASLGKINLVGYANESRRVGDVIYVIGSNLNQYYGYYGEDDSQTDQGFVASVNVADPADPKAVDRKNIPGNGQNMHVSTTAIYAASSRYDNNANQSVTGVQIVDISDAAGAIKLRGSFDVPGTIRNRFFMDAFDGAFRIVTESFGFGFQQVRLFTYDLADEDNVTPLGQVQIIQDESLEAVRFDGVRGYAVTFFRVDPLFVIDLSDAANPKVTGELEVPGFSTHIEPRGDRLIAVGIDDTDGNRPAVAYYDVSNPAAPTQLGRVILGPPGSYTTSEATYDEKAFKVIDELGLIVVPFHHFEYDGGFAIDPVEPNFAFEDEGDSSAPSVGATTVAADIAPDPKCTNGVQLVDFSDTALTQRGMFETVGQANRVGAIGDRVFALSALGLQTVDITDRDNPKQAGAAMFFSAEEMQQVEPCYGYYDGPIGFPIDTVVDQPVILFFDAEAVQALMSALQTCGAVPGATALMIPAAMMFMRRRIRRRR